MADRGGLKLIQLVRSVPLNEEQRRISGFIPPLELDRDATRILIEQFQSPIYVLAFMGNMGVGKSKVASLTVASLIKQLSDEELPTFESGDELHGVTHGVWMWPQPLKHPQVKRGSVLVLDCEGMGSNDKETNRNLYFFCMLVSSVLGILLRPARMECDQLQRLQFALSRFEPMHSPRILPSTWIIPLELPEFQMNKKSVTAEQWLGNLFTLSNEVKKTLSEDEQNKFQERCEYIRRTLPPINAINLPYLPNELKGTNFNLNQMKNILEQATNQEYRSSLDEMLQKVLKNQEKRLPGNNARNALLVRPAELVLFMTDLVEVINRTVSNPNADNLIGQCLLKRFEDEYVRKEEAKFHEKLLQNAVAYAKKKIEHGETNFDPHEVETIIANNRSQLISESVNNLRKSADEEVYGPDSQFTESDAFRRSLEEVRRRMESYDDVRLLFDKIRAIYNGGTGETHDVQLNREFRTRLKSATDRLCREEKINQAIQKDELSCEVEQCSRCHRQAGLISITHRCANGKESNCYRYENQGMVCAGCREIMSIIENTVACAKCGKARRIRRFVS